MADMFIPERAFDCPRRNQRFDSYVGAQPRRSRNPTIRSLHLVFHRHRVQHDQASGPRQGCRLCGYMVRLPTIIVPNLTDLVFSHRLVPAALVPRPWDFAPAPAPVSVTQSTPIDEQGGESEPANSDEPATSPQSPSIELPSSRPASPPTLLPPLAIHATSFDEPQANHAPPVDETPVEVEKREGSSDSEDLPIVAIVPPTPTSIDSTASAETAIAV